DRMGVFLAWSSHGARLGTLRWPRWVAAGIFCRAGGSAAWLPRIHRTLATRGSPAHRRHGGGHRRRDLLAVRPVALPRAPWRLSVAPNARRLAAQLRGCRDARP